MDNLIKCPKCNGSEQGCEYCAFVGYIYNEAGKHFTLTLDKNNNPVKGEPVGSKPEPPQVLQPQEVKPVTNGIFASLFPSPEPQDMIWFFKRKRD